MSDFTKSDIKKRLLYRNVPDPATFLHKNKKTKYGPMTSSNIENLMNQREYEINNKVIVDDVIMMVQLSIDEQKEKGVYLSCNYPESEIFKIMAAHDINEKKWIEPFRGGTSNLPYLFEPVPNGFTTIHIRFLQISQDVVFDRIGLEFYSKNILKKDDTSHINIHDLSFDEKNKIINAFWFIYFGLDKYPDFIQNFDNIKEEFDIYKSNKKFYYFNKSYDGKYISWDTFDIKMYDVATKPSSFNQNHKYMLNKFMKNFIYPSKIEYKDNKKTNVSMYTIISFLKKQCNEIKTDKNKFDKHTKNAQKFFNDFENISEDYISILSLDKDLLSIFVRRWTTFFWNVIPEKDSEKKNIPEEYMYIPNIITNKISWLKVKVEHNRI